MFQFLIDNYCPPSLLPDDTNTTITITITIIIVVVVVVVVGMIMIVIVVLRTTVCLVCNLKF